MRSLHHVYVDAAGREVVRFLGMFSTLALTMRAKGIAATRPGFAAYPRAFTHNADRLDLPGWPEGFVTVGGPQRVPQHRPRPRDRCDSRTLAHGGATFYIAEHAYQTSTGEWSKRLIGYFTSRRRADREIRVRRQEPGFRHYPKGFRISRKCVDVLYWSSGFSISSDERRHRR